MKWIITFALMVCCISGSFAQDNTDKQLSNEEMDAVCFSKNDTLGFKSLTKNTSMSNFRGSENRELRRTMRRIVELLKEDSDSTPYDLMGMAGWTTTPYVDRKTGKEIYKDVATTKMWFPRYRTTPTGVEIVCWRRFASPTNDVLSYVRTLDYILVGPDGTMNLVKTVKVDTNPHPQPVGRVAFYYNSGGNPVQYVFPETGDTSAKQIPPQFRGETGEFAQYMLEHVKYPPLAAEYGIQGKVVVSFTIGADGSLSGMKEIRTVDPLLTKAVERCIHQTEGMWASGTVDGIPTHVEVVFWIDFIIDFVAPENPRRIILHQ